MITPRVRRAAYACAAVLVLVTAVTTMAAVTPEVVLGQSGVEEGLGYSNTQYLAWTQNSTGRPRHYDAYAQLLTGGPTTRLNDAGTEGYPGGFDPGTDTVIYQQAARSSQLFFFNLDTQERTPVPGVNTRWWEWGPQISTDFILFDRDSKRNGIWYSSMLLYNRSTQTTRKLATWVDERVYTPTGGVGGSYASWTVCNRSTCRAFVYDIAARTIRRLPTADRRYGYAPVVDEVNGHVYFVESGKRCGSNVAIWRLPVGDFSAVPTKIVDLPDGIDTGWVSTLAPNATVEGSQDVFFERWICGQGEGDIYVARDATSVPDAPTAARVSGGTPGSSFDMYGRADTGGDR